MMELHQSIHASSGSCLWTLLTLAVAAVLVAVLAVHTVKQNKRESEHKDMLEEKYGISK
ncbi:MAG: hypothetical protein KBS68_04010 [Clostridiales bacterium]|nr:hypothetical protein [Candidatus Crickella merdequi]